MDAFPNHLAVRSLSPAYWYLYDSDKAKRECGRGQVGRPYGTKDEAHAALGLLKPKGEAS